MQYLRLSPPPQLIVLDLMMPGVDGWELRHAQKQDPTLAGIPVIAVSAAGKLLDADAQFRKPLDYEKFLDGSAVRQAGAGLMPPLVISASPVPERRTEGCFRVRGRCSRHPTGSVQ